MDHLGDVGRGMLHQTDLKADGDCPRVVVLSKKVQLLFPPLLLGALPRNSIGFSYPTGIVGLILGGASAAATVGMSFIISSRFGIATIPIVLWLVGGTSTLIVYNSLGTGVVFIKPLCSTCRFREIIIEHERFHLGGIESEREVWRLARTRHDVADLNLDSDTSLCPQCPIPQRFRQA
jgi:hypothetical protein